MDVSEFRDLLNEVVVEYIMESSTDFVEFASGYFLKKIQKRDVEISPSGSSDGNVAERDSTLIESIRRGAVLGLQHTNEEDTANFTPISYPKTEEQKEKLINICKKIVLFKNVGKQEMDQLVDAMQKKDVSAGEFVIQQGDEGDFFYCIEKGRFSALLNGSVVKEYEDEGSFGELALLYDQPRKCSVRADTVGVLWALDRNTFQTILLKYALNKRSFYESLMHRVPMLRNLSDYERANLTDAFQPETYEDGDIIIRQGDPADKMYFIESGTVVVRCIDMATGDERDVNYLNEGDYFGEMALINNVPRAASVYAQGEVNVVTLPVDAFERLLGPCMEIMKRNILDYSTL